MATEEGELVTRTEIEGRQERGCGLVVFVHAHVSSFGRRGTWP